MDGLSPASSALSRQFEHEELHSRSNAYDRSVLEKAKAAYLADREGDAPDATLAFSYALALTLSPKRADKFAGIALLEGLIDASVSPQTTGECLYFMGVASYKLGEFRASRLAAERLLRQQPDHAKAAALHALVRARVQADGARGLAWAAGVALAAAAVGTYFLRSRR